MATIYLIRHGQAQFGMEEYDALSPTGIEQAKLLGASFLQRTIIPTKIISGAMKRHQQTMDYCLEKMQIENPEKITNNDWNEFDHRDIIAKYEPRYADLNELKKDIFLDKSPKEKITEVLIGAVTRWTSGQQNDYNESWTTFCDRVKNGLQKIEKESQKEDIVFVFSSGGSISVIMQQILDLSVQKTFEMQLNIANCSITKLRTSSRGTQLLSFSDYAHFEGEHKKWLTYK
ncbi:MAG: histidine phosphatase family protein [Sphingobacteriales bacterium]|nr:histidine phosphatase family protein [Sphingobacteriales bacterium]